jgi:hypothetical protein
MSFRTLREDELTSFATHAATLRRLPANVWRRLKQAPLPPAHGTPACRTCRRSHGTRPFSSLMARGPSIASKPVTVPAAVSSYVTIRSARPGIARAVCASIRWTITAQPTGAVLERTLRVQSKYGTALSFPLTLMAANIGLQQPT